jgi:hypothetical protein
VGISKNSNDWPNIIIRDEVGNTEIDESVMGSKHKITEQVSKNIKINYLNSQIPQTENNTADKVHFHDGYKKRNKVFSNQYIKNTFTLSEYKDTSKQITKGPVAIL